MKMAEMMRNLNPRVKDDLEGLKFTQMSTMSDLERGATV